ncbi:hypothetical protein PsYK624_115100 [Phanerochaete sordida]|uniref:Uncharacterized protein n=1 Tax=Phanerochaete sordida TaxID=48140 RepID=A0A9P3GID4_9APHY|nr:hypothetical protein PsYK624_115100 [Phanerochaete sordida]
MCRGHDTRDYAKLHHFLRKVGAAVEYLEVGIPSQSSSSRWAARIDLARGFTLEMCPKLRELRIKCRSWQHNLPRACNIFLASLPPSIRRIRFELVIHPARDGSHRIKYENTALVPIWQLVDRATAPYEGLEEVEIAAPFVSDPPPLELLAGCSARFGQILKISRLVD